MKTIAHLDLSGDSLQHSAHRHMDAPTDAAKPKDPEICRFGDIFP